MSADPTNLSPSAGKDADSIPVRDADAWHIERDTDHLSLQFTTSTQQLRSVRLAIEAFCRDGGFDEKSWSEVGLVVNEAVANIIRHAYDADRPMPIDLAADLNSDGVTISLRDWGKGAIPLPKSPFGRTRDAQSSEQIPEPGGLGLICMKQLMDEVSFVPQHPGMLLQMSRARQR